MSNTWEKNKTGYNCFSTALFQNASALKFVLFPRVWKLDWRTIFAFCFNWELFLIDDSSIVFYLQLYHWTPMYQTTTIPFLNTFENTKGDKHYIPINILRRHQITN